MGRTRALAASVLVAGLVAACGSSAAPQKPASPPALGGPASPALASRCTLAATYGLQAVSIQAPGPLGTMARSYQLHVPPGAGAPGPVPPLVRLPRLRAHGTIPNSIT